MILYGSGADEIRFAYDDGLRAYEVKKPFEGVVANLERRYKETESEWSREEIQRYMTATPCEACHGFRLKPEALAVKIDGQHIGEVSLLSVSAAIEWAKGLPAKLDAKRNEIAQRILKEIVDRLTFLRDVGLDYLTLRASSGTLSGGESQRIRLASQIGSGLTGVLYVLDEPSIGLHQRDNARLLDTLRRLRGLGNTVIVVEHDEDAIWAADYVVDVGPGAGVHGGEIVAEGTPAEIAANPNSLTGHYLSGERTVAIPARRRAADPGRELTIVGARGNNLKNVTATIPLGLFTCVTGVSGGGKSTLVIDTLYKAAARHLNGANEPPAPHERIDGLERDRQGDRHRPVADRPHAALEPGDLHRRLHADPRLVRRAAGGEGARLSAGPLLLQRQGRALRSLPGRRRDQDRDALSARRLCHLRRVQGQALRPRDARGALQGQVDRRRARHDGRGGGGTVQGGAVDPRQDGDLEAGGLGYVKVGQQATTLSGGEAQRVKLAKELSRRSTGRTLYILDEPTTGLHFHDVAQLLDVLHELVDQGNTMIVIEHNLEVVKTADWIVDMGPEGGDGGGEVVAEGTPEQIARNPKSYTGQYLKPVLARKAKGARRRSKSAPHLREGDFRRAAMEPSAPGDRPH